MAYRPGGEDPPMPLAAQGVADLLGVPVNNVYGYIRLARQRRAAIAAGQQVRAGRDPFPEPSGKVAQADAWWPWHVEAWARRVGLWPHGDRSAVEVLRRGGAEKVSGDS